MPELTQDQILLGIGLLVVLIAITLHEAGHAFAAKWLGDDTAERLGRASLLPWRHIDPIGTILLPAFLLVNGLPAFGWAKPVPVIFGRLRDPRWGAFLVAIAGPGMNLLQLTIAAIALMIGLPLGMDEFIASILLQVVFFNTVLIFFNLLPFPPLDGSRVLTAIYPPLLKPFHRFERLGVFLVLGFFILVPQLTAMLGAPVNPAQWLIAEPAKAVTDTIIRLSVP